MKKKEEISESNNFFINNVLSFDDIKKLDNDFPNPNFDLFNNNVSPFENEFPLYDGDLFYDNEFFEKLDDYFPNTEYSLNGDLVTEPSKKIIEKKILQKKEDNPILIIEDCDPIYQNIESTEILEEIENKISVNRDELSLILQNNVNLQQLVKKLTSDNSKLQNINEALSKENRYLCKQNQDFLTSSFTIPSYTDRIKKEKEQKNEYTVYKLQSR